MLPRPLRPSGRLSLAVWFLAAGACGGETVVAVGGGAIGSDGAEFPEGDAGPPGADAGDPSGPKDPGGELHREIIVLHDTSVPVSLPVTTTTLLRAKVIDYGASGPAADAAVSFAIVEQDVEDGDAGVSTQMAFTDENGEVGVTFLAGNVPEVGYTIRLATEGADPVEFEVFVTDEPKGDITVHVVYEGPINVKNVHVRLFEGGYTCGQFNPTNVSDQVLGEKTLLGIGDGADVEWKDLPDGQKYTVAATALSPKGSLAAAGCIDGVVVIPDEENVVTLTMHLLTLNPAGAYDAVTVFDFTGAIPGEVGEIVDQIVLLFNNPGKFIIDNIKQVVTLWVPQIITDAIFSLFEDELAAVITGWLLNDSPDWLQDIFVIGQDLTQVVHHLTMLADLKISKLQNEYYVQGLLDWKGVVLYWHYGCPKEGEPDYDPECGANVFSIDQFANAQFPMDIIQGKFTGSITDFDKLDVDNHVIKINYGKLIIFVLNEMILPAITGEHNLTDAILSIIDCPSLGKSFSDGLLSGLFNLFGLGEDEITDFCIDGITLVVKPVEILIGSLALDSQLRLAGHATLVDVDSNLLVDDIVDGIWIGHIEADGQEGPQFDGMWEAHRVQ